MSINENKSKLTFTPDTGDYSLEIYFSKDIPPEKEERIIDKIHQILKEEGLECSGIEKWEPANQNNTSL